VFIYFAGGHGHEQRSFMSERSWPKAQKDKEMIMKKNKLCVVVMAALALVFGMVLVGCDMEVSNPFVGTWIGNERVPTIPTSTYSYTIVFTDTPFEYTCRVPGVIGVTAHTEKIKGTYKYSNSDKVYTFSATTTGVDYLEDEVSIWGRWQTSGSHLDSNTDIFTTGTLSDNKLHVNSVTYTQTN
jgi:hypothetical protein